MGDPWEVLLSAGVPAGPARPPPRRLPPAEDLRRAVTITGVSLDERLTTPLLAWLRGFRQHWPVRFQTVLGALGDSVIEALSSRCGDTNHYLKLRRIAIENLAGALR